MSQSSDSEKVFKDVAIQSGANKIDDWESSDSSGSDEPIIVTPPSNQSG